MLSISPPTHRTKTICGRGKKAAVLKPGREAPPGPKPTDASTVGFSLWTVGDQMLSKPLVYGILGWRL